jgi:rSAM/selenodomain-associated transferase 2
MAAMVALGHPSHHLLAFCILYGLAFVLLAGLVNRFPGYLDPCRAFLVIIVLGLAARAIFLFYPPGNDIYRYIWEGCIQSRGFNPYLYAPDDPVLSAIAQSDLYPVWESVNHKSFSAVYPPLALLVFRWLADLKPEPTLFKIFFVLLDVGSMIILASIIRLKNLPPRRLLWYACNPLVIVFIAGEGHLDGIQVFFLFLAVLLFLIRKDAGGFLSLGLSTVVKYFSAVPIPFFITAKNRWKGLWVVLPILVYIPYADAGADIFKSLVSFGTGMHYNDSLFAVLRWLFGAYAPLAGCILLFAGLAWIFLFVHDPVRSAYLACGCLLVLLPTLHPWYLILMAPFLVFFPSKAWLWLQLAVVFTFPVMAVDAKTGVFQEIHWLKIFEYGPFYGLLVWGLFGNGNLFNPRRYSRAATISVVIPTLNESKSLGRTLMSLHNRTGLKEVIIADGGSTDDTCRIAKDHGAQVVRSQKGRGGQIKSGVDAAGGDVILILHADCMARRGVFARILGALEASPHIAGGACAMAFEQRDIKTRIIAGLNNLRARLTGISFGDQAQFFRARAIDPMGGVPEMMLMEDVELSLRLKQAGGVLFLGSGVTASGRRWQAVAFSRNIATVVRLFVRYLIERRLGRVKEFGRKYYVDYYGR